MRFVVGRPANDSGSGDRQRALVKEQAGHGDLIQLDFVDTYQNLTLKGVGAMQWLTDYCDSTRSDSEPNCELVYCAGYKLTTTIRLLFDLAPTVRRTTLRSCC